MSWRKMVYRATKRPDGQIVVLDPDYMSHNTRIVESERECEIAYEQGWCPGPQEAMAAFERAEDELSNQAAHRGHDDRNMSEAAQAEALAVESQTVAHVAEIPVAPKRGRPRKIVQ